MKKTRIKGMIKCYGREYLAAMHLNKDIRLRRNRTRLLLLREVCSEWPKYIEMIDSYLGM